MTDSVVDLGREVEGGLADLHKVMVDDPCPDVIWDGDEQYDGPFEPFSIPADGRERERVMSDVRDRGIEAIAFYKSYRDVAHGPYPGSWGVYFLKSAVSALIAEISATSGMSFGQCKDATVKFVHTHELYHYKLDAWCLGVEAQTRKSVYRRYRNDVYSRPLAEWWEEGIANFYGLRSLAHTAFPITQALRDMVQATPGAYAHGVDPQAMSQFGIRSSLAVQVMRAISKGGSILGPLHTTFMKNLVYRQLRMNVGGYGGVNDSFLAHPFISLKRTCPLHWINRHSMTSKIPTMHLGEVA
jgi:hypothetical protein